MADFDAEKVSDSKGQPTGVAIFDPTDPEAVLDAILDLGARVSALEAEKSTGKPIRHLGGTAGGADHEMFDEVPG